MYQYICSKCGGHLDPGEKCDCEEEKKRQQHFKFKTTADGQLFISFDKRTRQLQVKER